MKRSLSEMEFSQVHDVFGDSLRYSDIWLIEGVQWPNTIDRLGAWIRGETPSLNNAITLGNRIYFPILLRTSEENLHSGHLGHFAWLIHEMTHVWQYQHIGFVYFLQALWGQIRLGRDVYDYGGKQGLHDALTEGNDILAFNPEQQGDIVRDYYLRMSRGMDTTAWQPFVTSLQRG
jgi:hypothetical protein